MEIKRASTANENASLPAENGAANCGRSLLPALPNVPPARSCSPLLCPYQTGVCAKLILSNEEEPWQAFFIDTAPTSRTPMNIKTTKPGGSSPQATGRRASLLHSAHHRQSP